jgi:ribosomal-protein-alanine N-acetyltransferase
MSEHILETDRLILRQLQMSDLDDLFALYRDPDIRRYFPEGTLTRSETLQELTWFVEGGDPAHPTLGLWATIHKETQAFIGRCGLIPWTIDGKLEIEIAYMLAKPYWGQGLGGEVAQALVRYGFGALDLSRLIALIDPDNEASARTAMKAGLRHEKNIDHDGVACCVYAIEKIDGPRASFEDY